MDKTRTKRKLKLKNIFIKKYNGSNEISTRLTESNEKENEINYQHHYYSYPNNTIVEFVNDDCLTAIFMFVPACERPKIALVCQKWKRALCQSWSNVKKLELTHWEYDEYPTCLKKYPTLDGQFNFLKSLLYKCGRYLTKLDLTAYGHCNIVPVINEYCQNLVELRLRFTYVDKIILYDALSRLSKLKLLSIIFQDFKDRFIPLNLIYSLRNVADTLTDLILSNWKDNYYTNPCFFPGDTICVLRELRALKRFEIGGIRISDVLGSYLTSSVPTCCFYDDYFHDRRKAQFKDITTLILRNYRITDHGLYTIANTIKRLKELRMDSTHLTNEGIVTVSKMNLEILTFPGLNNVIDSSSIKMLKNLEVIAFPFNNNVTDDLAIEVLKNSPNLYTLYVMCTSVTVEFIKRAEKISRNRKRHLKIGIAFECDKKKYESPYLTIHITLP